MRVAPWSAGTPSLTASAERCTRPRLDGALIVLTGEAGVGKTSIAEACATDGAARGFHVLSVANYHSARAPFGPFLEVMRMLARERPEAVPAAAGDRLVFERFIGTAPVAGSEQPLDKRRFFVVAAEVLERSAAVTPLLAIVEDAHWSDPESLEFLRFFAPRLATAPIVVIVTLRTDADDDALAVQIDALSRLPVTQRHTVTPLDDRSLLTIITLSAPNVSLDAENAAALCRRAEGNPLIALELARDAASGAPLPSSFVTAIGARLRNLQPSERTAIEAASVVGRTFAFSDLQALLNLPRTTLISAIRGARDAGIVEETAIGFAFRHERLREAVETRMLAVERSDLHRRRALALEALGGDAALLAMHWAAANEPARAAPFAERAGDEAMARDAFATARARYREALAGSDDDAAVRLEPKLARASESLGDAAGAARWYDAAAQRARAAGTDDGRWRLRAADSQYRAGHRDEAMAAVRLLLAETADASLQFDGAALLAMYHAYAGEAEFAEHFIGVARGYDGPRDPIRALACLGARRHGDPPRRRRMAGGRQRCGRDRGGIGRRGPDRDQSSQLQRHGTSPRQAS
ncbi:ATP-binding protein [Vulcanimicrobium alpinum]|uniref:ATP-binding protein n=1 Tax=Vulcanimicrobium alpinum TaxID=3016050 RepID=UPI00386E5993